MKAIRFAGALVIAAATLAAIYAFSVRPLIWNRAGAHAQLLMHRVFTERNDYRTNDRAREVLRETARYASPSTHDVRLHFYRAVAWEVLQNHEAAIDEIALALRADQRPELYLNLAHSLIRTGRKDEATDAAALAIRFRRTDAKFIEDNELRARLENALKVRPCDGSELATAERLRRP